MNPWFFAITVSVLIYAAFLILFSSAEIKGIKSPSDAPQIIMLPINSNNRHPAQKQLLYWLKDDNPTLIVTPNSMYGYSSILNHDFKFSPDNPSLDINSILTEQYFFSVPFSINPINVSSSSLIQLISSLDLINNPNVPPIPFSHKKIEKLSYPYVKDYYSGAQIPVKFNNIKIIQELIKKYSPKRPTILIAEFPSNPLYFPIVNTISSCGSPELDKIAKNNLITANLSKDKSFQGRQIKVYVEWQSSDNRQQTTDNRQQTTDNRQQTTDNRQQTTDNRQQTTDNRQQTTDNRQQTTDNRQQTTDNRQQTTDNRQQTTDNRQQTTDNRQQTTDNRQQTTDNRQPVASN